MAERARPAFTETADRAKDHGTMRIRDQEGEAGFTIVELMTVILIIALLIAIALPTYLGARQRAADRAIQTDMRTGLAAALAYYSETASWDGFDATQAAREEPRLTWVNGGAPARGEVSIHVHSDQDLLLVGLSSSHTYFCLAQVATSPATDTSQGQTFAQVDTVAECNNGW
jgi:type IV pilus assembly protein PilA